MNKEIVKKFFPKAVKRVEEGKCPVCGKEIPFYDAFRDEESHREYRISGMCQECQDKTFKK